MFGFTNRALNFCYQFLVPLPLFYHFLIFNIFILSSTIINYSALPFIGDSALYFIEDPISLLIHSSKLCFPKRFISLIELF